MAQVEQAVFTSAETSRSAGYQVVSRSRGVSESDARELAVWGPSHDSLLDLGPDAASINFHPLPSGAFCVSQTTAAGWEYSGRGGHRVYTQCLIVSPDEFERFANNPFALIRAASAAAMLQAHDRVPEQLPSLQLPGSAAAVDQDLLARLANGPGPARLATMVQTALDSACLAVGGEPSAGELIAGLFSCLPVECRREFSFSTGLKFSSRRPFRIVALSADKAEQRWVAHQNNVTVLDLGADLPLEAMPLDGWAQLIGRVLASGRISFLARYLSDRHAHLAVDDLPALGLQLLEDLDASALRCDHRQEASDDAADFSAGAAEKSAELTRAHAAHHDFQKSPGTAVAATVIEKIRAEAPSKTLDVSSPEALEKLERLDDLVYDAIAGQTTAMEELHAYWLRLVDELGDELVAESRQRYLNYALSIWEKCVQPAGIRNPARAMQALDVLCVIFDGT